MPEVTAIASTSPGADELLRLKQEYLLPCTHHFYARPPKLVAGHGCHLVDDTGRRYLDCFTGVTVMSAGHCNPAIIEPAIEQIRALQHTTSIYLTEPTLRLAERLAGIAPGDLRRSFFTASGTEAVEGAMMLAAIATGRRRFVAMRGGLHGRTRWALSATGVPMWRIDPFPIDDVAHVPFGNLDALAAHLRRHRGEIAAVLAEPIQSNGGIVAPPEGYWPAVRALCDAHGVLLILDEIQSGMNRTGRWFACSHWGVTPDVLVTSKALGNGFPIAAFMTTDEHAAHFNRPSASTHGGNPVSAVAALATIDFHESHALGAAAEARGTQFADGLRHRADTCPHVGAVRGLGLMLGAPVVGDDGAPDAARCDRWLEALKDHGVLAGKTGLDRNVLTFLPPLIIDPAQVEEVLDALDVVIEED